MKIWYQHGSEHSANLVMIGRFKDETKATRAKEVIDALTKHVRKEEESGKRVIGSPPERYGKEMLDLLARLDFAAVAPRELDQFAYEVSVEVEGDKIFLTTEEDDVSAFLKVMIHYGARIEVYSAHDYPDTAHGRGR